ncbi:sensor histidine kinase KdpD, partial [uncultured Clostridium sp.]
CVQLLDINKEEGEKSLWNSYNKYDNTIKQNCYRLLRLVNNLVDITKIDSGYMNLNFVNYEIVDLVEDITLSIVPYVESKNINVLFDTFIEELEIRCDPESIERVILNLISNAVKFTNNDGNICVLMDADDNYVTIRVKDDGVGISKDVQEEIFKRFVQEDKSFNRKKEGSGIGLALVKSLVELYDGQVYLESNVEKGSEFVVKLPNVRIENEEENDNKVMDADNKPLVQKIHIEFSDIYELY